MLPDSVKNAAQLSGGKKVKIFTIDGTEFEVDGEKKTSDPGPTESQICLAMLQREQADLIAKHDVLQKTVEATQSLYETLLVAIQALSEKQITITQALENNSRILMLPVKAMYDKGKAVGAVRVDDKK